MFILTGIIMFIRRIGMFMHKKLTPIFPTYRECLPFSYWAELHPTKITISTTGVTINHSIGLVLVKIWPAEEHLIQTAEARPWLKETLTCSRSHGQPTLR